MVNMKNSMVHTNLKLKKLQLHVYMLQISLKYLDNLRLAGLYV